MAKKRRPIPFLTGVTNNETGNAHPSNSLNLMQNVFAECAVAAKIYSFELPNLVAAACADFYTKGANANDSTSQIMAKIRLDAGYILPAFADATAMRDAGSTQVYFYSFDYERMPGVGFTHAQDLNYLFGFDFTEKWGNATTDDDTLMAMIYSSYFLQFAKTGRPTTAGKDWEPLSSPLGDNYYSITLPQPGNRPHFYPQRMRFWTQTVPNLIKGAKLEAQALGVPAAIDAKPYTVYYVNGTPWPLARTAALAFWSMVALLLLTLVVQVVYLLVRCVRGATKGASDDAKVGDATEHTRLATPPQVKATMGRAGQRK